MKGRSRAIVLVVVTLILVVGTCSSCGTQTVQPQAGVQTPGPLTKSEKAFIKNAKSTHKLVTRSVAVLAVFALHVRDRTATTKQDNAARKFFNSLKKTVQAWDNVEQPSERMAKATDLWYKVVNDYVSVLNRFAALHNDYAFHPERAHRATGDAFLKAWLKTGKDYGRFLKEANRVQRAARSG